jgi:hypothetical protein
MRNGAYLEGWANGLVNNIEIGESDAQDDGDGNMCGDGECLRNIRYGIFKECGASGDTWDTV